MKQFGGIRAALENAYPETRFALNDVIRMFISVYDWLLRGSDVFFFIIKKIKLILRNSLMPLQLRRVLILYWSVRNGVM